MKKLFKPLIFATLILCILSINVFAAKEFTKDLIGEKDTVFASFHDISKFIGHKKNPAEIEDVTFWIAQNAKDYNVKYVSYLGPVSAGSRLTYANYVTALGKTRAELAADAVLDKDWNAEFQELASITQLLANAEIPFGVSAGLDGTISQGIERSSIMYQYFPIDTIMPSDAVYGSLNDRNYYTIIEDNGKRFIVFQLELWPKAATLDWFNTTLSEHQDKYAIVYTPSFLDASGQMYTMWDWATGYEAIGTTYIRKYNLTWDGQPRDGQELWNYSFSKFDNILAVISSFPSTSSKIVTNKFKNPNGYETIGVVANSSTFPIDDGAVILMTKISEDCKTFTFYYMNPFTGLKEELTQTVTLNKLAPLAEPVVTFTHPKIPYQYNGANKAYILGFDDGTFRPNENMTRAQACTIFARLLLGTNEIPAGYTTRFTDVKTGSWYYNAVAYLDENEFFNQIDGTTYKPEEPITRAEFVDLANKASSLVGNNKVSFTDVPADHFYYEAIMAAAQSGLVNGYEDETFRPDNTITRAEVVTVVNRLLNLTVSDKYVDESKQANTFKDISKHWAKNSILMASNDNVHGAYYYDATLDGVTETGSSITIANDYISISISKNNGKITKVINVQTGKDITGTTDTPQFVYLTDESGTKQNPLNVDIDGNRLKFTFKKAVVYAIIDVHSNFITVEIDSQLPKSDFKSCYLGAVSINDPYIKDDPESWTIGCMGMVAWMTNPPDAIGDTKTWGRADTIYSEGVMGAKLGIVYSQQKDFMKNVQALTDNIDRSVGIANKTAGAYSLEHKPNYYDYALVRDSSMENIKLTAKYAKDIGIEQLDFHQGWQTFRQGDFYFYHTESGTAKEFYENQGKYLKDLGIDYTLHTYAYYIPTDAKSIVTNPKWQKQLEVSEEFTLEKDITKFRVNIPTVEDVSKFDLTTGFFYHNMRYILIDEEIIYIGINGTPSGFINVKRGQLGTEATSHKAGTKIKHLSGLFNMFAPALDSELFYHVADLTAKAYNDGGFSLIYIDAIDGLNRHIPEGTETWYYFQKFVQRVLSQCKTDPIIEFSANATQVWNARGRYGAWDTANKSIKKFVNEHIKINKNYLATNNIATLGWFEFFPDDDPIGGMKNTIQKTLFHDDLDYMGSQAIVYNMTIVYNPFDPASYAENPTAYNNIMYYNNNYNNLRKSEYFDSSVIDTVKAQIEKGVEFRVVENTSGKYAFEETYYNFSKLGRYVKEADFNFSGNNPYKEQKPFVRIESRFSTLFENPTTLTTFEGETLTKTDNKAISKPLENVDLTESSAMVVTVTGTGNAGDAALLTLKGVSSESSGHVDYFIDLSFNGTKDVYLIDSDNADYDWDTYKFNGIGVTGMQYATYRENPNWKNLTTLELRLSGNTATNAKLSDVVAYKQTNAPTKNPTVTVGSSTMTFNTTLNSGEYIEYDPRTNKALAYRVDQSVEEIKFTGSISVNAGNFTGTYSAEAQTDADVRARVVFGFYGPQYANPEK